MAEYEDAGGGEDIRAALAQQLLSLRPRDLLSQTAVMLANQAAIRLGLASPAHQDREQAREAIDALGGIVELLVPLAPPDEIEALRRDLAQLRMAFVQSSAASPVMQATSATVGASCAARRGAAGPRGAGRRRPGWGAPADLDAAGRGLTPLD